jgi:biopolymer transport protein ExbD
MKLKYVPKRSLEINMVPMIDLVFQLLIFFLVACQVKKQEVDAELILPTALQSKEMTDDPKHLPLTVNILSPEVSKAKPYVVMGSMLSLDEFKRWLKERKRFLAERYGGEKGEMPPVRIRADKGSQFVDVQHALIACREVGIWQVKLSTIKRK